jgi:hypothetical protein
VANLRLSTATAVALRRRLVSVVRDALHLLRQPWAAWSPVAQSSALWLFGVVIAGLLLLQWRLHQSSESELKRDLAHQRHLLQGLSASGSDTQSAETAAPDLTYPIRQTLRPDLWPVGYAATEDWVRTAAQQTASSTGVLLQQLSLTYAQKSSATAVDSTASMAPALADARYAQLQVSARGSYAALKAWHASMLAQMPSLALEQLRWQTSANDGSGQLSVQSNWRLWIRKDLKEHVQASEPTGPPAPLRPLIGSAQRDPFGMTPAPVQQPIPAPVMSTPIIVPTVPAVPPLLWHTIGQMTGADGQRLITGHWGDPQSSETLKLGSESPRGHKLTRITSQVIEFEHPQTQERLQFSLPPMPRFERR